MGKMSKGMLDFMKEYTKGRKLCFNCKFWKQITAFFDGMFGNCTEPELIKIIGEQTHTFADTCNFHKSKNKGGNKNKN